MSPLRAGHEHTHAPTSFVLAVAAACDARGLKLTAMRRRVLELIAAPTQVYRALDFLVENGFVHKLESINAFTSCHHPAERHTVPFFICSRCGGATEFCDSKVAEMLVAHAAKLGFTAQAQTLEVHGVCARCTGAAA